jgi:hypothetical protein
MMMVTTAGRDDDPVVLVVETIRAAMATLTHDERLEVVEGLRAWVELEAAEVPRERVN